MRWTRVVLTADSIDVWHPGWGGVVVVVVNGPWTQGPYGSPEDRV